VRNLSSAIPLSLSLSLDPLDPLTSSAIAVGQGLRQRILGRYRERTRESPSIELDKQDRLVDWDLVAASVLHLEPVIHTLPSVRFPVRVGSGSVRVSGNLPRFDFDLRIPSIWQQIREGEGCSALVRV
jgi:hypothetical protein